MEAEGNQEIQGIQPAPKGQKALLINTVCLK